MRQFRVGWKELSEMPHLIKAESLPKARSTMRALLTLATLEPTENRLTDTVVLALMNWISKGNRTTDPFSARSFPSQSVVLGYYGENSTGKHFGCG